MNTTATQVGIRKRAGEWLRGFPLLVRSKRAVWDIADRLVHRHDREILARLSLFAPNSPGTTKARAELTLLAARQTFPFIAHFLDVAGQRYPLTTVAKSEDLCESAESRSSAARLKHHFDVYGSDKADAHDYHHIYGSILNNPDSVTAVLEIGLGTNNRDVVSNMGAGGKPGASLRAFRDFLPRARVYGADVDRRILFEEDRIKTFYVDQTDLRTLDELGRNVGGDFDLIIDDGLHAPNANIAVLAFAFEKLKTGGWLIVEDIGPSALPVWQVMAALLPAGHHPRLIAAKGGLVFAVQKMAPPK